MRLVSNQAQMQQAVAQPHQAQGNQANSANQGQGGNNQAGGASASAAGAGAGGGLQATAQEFYPAGWQQADQQADVAMPQAAPHRWVRVYTAELVEPKPELTPQECVAQAAIRAMNSL